VAFAKNVTSNAPLCAAKCQKVAAKLTDYIPKYRSIFFLYTHDLIKRILSGVNITYDIFLQSALQP